MVNGENACHSQILNQPFQNNDVENESRHPCIFSCNTVEKIFFCHAITSKHYFRH